MPSDTMTPGLSDAPVAPDHSARNRVVILLLLVSTFTMILNETIMSVALPRLMSDLGVTANAAQWLTTAFLLTMAVVIPVTGFPLQRFHTRTVFIAALSFFSFGTLLCAIAPGLPPLVLGRVAATVIVLAAALATANLARIRGVPLRLALLAGVLDAVATVTSLLALQASLLSLAGVLIALYPAATVLLAIVVLRERVTSWQAVGMVLALSAVALITAG